jgi:hypothetical protein
MTTITKRIQKLDKRIARLQGMREALLVLLPPPVLPIGEGSCVSPSPYANNTNKYKKERYTIMGCDDPPF